MTRADLSPTTADGASPISRRVALGAGLGGAALLATSSRASARTPSTPAPSTATTPAVATLRFLFDRITYGFNAAMWQRAQTLGYAAFLEEQLHPEWIADPRVDAALTHFPSVSMTSKQLYDQYYAAGQGYTPPAELRALAILRASLSEHQLHERMVEFWNDHFSIDHSDSQELVLKTAEDRDVVRAHALGNFQDLLIGSARSAAMAFYLGNYRNTAASPNENYGRELMELHTLGVGNYTENDVREVARCFTGWSFLQHSDPNYGDFVFDPASHDSGAKTVLGQSIAAGGGVQDGERVLRILAMHPATAQFIALKLCRWFISYTPPQPLVDRVANAYLRTRGDIKAMIRTIFDPISIALVPQDRLPKLKRPFHLVCSIFRALDANLAQPAQLTNELVKMGHQPYVWPTPKGYPDSTEAWGSGLLTRWTFASALFSNSISGVSIAAGPIFANVPRDQLAAAASQRLTGGSLARTDVAEIQTYVDAFPVITDALEREVLALAAASPSFQLY
jgi:uncharacterized protein (DUF1800 family)